MVAMGPELGDFDKGTTALKNPLLENEKNQRSLIMG